MYIFVKIMYRVIKMRRNSFVIFLLSVIVFNIYAEIPLGYYDAAKGLTNGELKTKIHEIIRPHTRISYGAGGTWEVFRNSDVRSDGSIWDMYSDVVRYFPSTGSHSEMHIEHSVPKSWWGESGSGNSSFVYEASFDMHHLVPSDASTNMSKSNFVLGVVETPSFDNGVSRIGKAMVDGVSRSVFEPHDDYKGDFARMYMYVFTCYQDYTWTSNGVYMLNNELYPTLNTYARNLLMKWHRQDPVSEKERNRNEAVYNAQKNRNPFIDFPHLAEYLWGEKIDYAFSFEAVDNTLSIPTGINAIEINSNQITWSWDKVSNADGYEVNCYSMQGAKLKTEKEGFDMVGSTGTPLPEGWIGTASGYYTSDAGTGEAIPSVALKNSKEYLQTPEYPAPVMEFSFMYRFASTATGSSLLVEYNRGGKWQTLQQIEYENTTKATLNYTFESSDDVRAFRFTYNKVKGNMAIDDVKVTYGVPAPKDIVKKQYVSNPSITINGLDALCTYYFNVRSVKGENRSEWSDIVEATTRESSSGMLLNNAPLFRYVVNGNIMTLSNLTDGAQVDVYDMRGILLQSIIATGAVAHITLPTSNIYILKIADKEQTTHNKVVM